MAMDLAEQQIADKSASSQLLTHFVKAGSQRERLEQERLRNENAVLRKKVETMEAAIDVKNLMSEAIQAFKGYTGDNISGDEDEGQEDYYD